MSDVSPPKQSKIVNLKSILRCQSSHHKSFFASWLAQPRFCDTTDGIMLTYCYRILLTGLMMIKIASCFPVIKTQQQDRNLLTAISSRRSYDHDNYDETGGVIPDNPGLLSTRTARILLPASVVALGFSSFIEKVNAASGGGDQQFDKARNEYFPGALGSSVMALRLSTCLLYTSPSPRD